MATGVPAPRASHFGTILWRWYAVLLLANALDVLFTYTAAERGFQELNPILKPILLTPWPVMWKLGALTLLAYGLWQLAESRQRSLPVLGLLQSATTIYLVVIVLHVFALRVIPIALRISPF